MKRLSRQSFLGANSSAELETATIGIVGLGGGGSHIVQQLAHIGVGRLVLVDPQDIEESNTNRLVGGTLNDVALHTAKVDIAERIIRGLNPTASIIKVKGGWITAVEELRICDVIIGALDSLVAKDQLEAFSRKNLIPYIDIGMTVAAVKGHHLIAGQVIRSFPGEPCLRCLGFVTAEKLKIDAEKYGDAGENPQVVWPNGVLASLAVGLCLEIVTPWHFGPRMKYLSYDGNLGIVRESPYVKAVRGVSCPHFPLNQVGQPRFKVNESTIPGQGESATPSVVGPWRGWVHWLKRFTER